VTAIKDVMTLLRDADLASKAELYAQLGLHLTYQPGPGTRTVIAKANFGRTCTQLSCPRGDLNPHALYGH
jgi:site-specific DNA recombinase